LAVAVPGLVSGLWELHQQQGRLAWPALLQPAVELARDGFPVCQMLAERIANHAGRFNRAARAVFLPEGRVPPVGSRLRQADLALALAAIAAGGPAAFYTGPVADSLAAAVQREGGMLSSADLAGYRPLWRQPVQGTYRGLEIWSMGPPSSGGVLLVQMLNILEGYDLRRLGRGAAGGLHVMIEAMKFAFADRSRYLGDPDFTAVPLARLLSPQYADSLRSRIQPGHALSCQEIPGGGTWPAESAETTHLSIIDHQGNAVAATLTINLTFGSGLLAGGTGVLLNDQMDDFAIAPGVPNAFGLLGGRANAVAAGKRPLSSMSPTILLERGRVRMVLGSPGGSRIITAVLQVIIAAVDHRLDIAAAVSAPRIHHQWYPVAVFYEDGALSPRELQQLELWGHQLELSQGMGNVQALQVDSRTAARWGASDWRGMGQPAGF
jgi:gamma-glutamyltranspeptidase/glutathione hydrolase